MATFEGLILLAAFAAVIILAVGVDVIANKLKEIVRRQENLRNELRSIRVYVSDTAEYTHNHIAPDIEIVSNNILHLLDEGKGLPALVDIVDKMHRNLCAEIADKMVDRAYPPTYNPPCYSPNGICTNPQMDCINCPKRGTGGTWTTSTNKIKED